MAQGLLDRLTPEQLNAVLTHERAHSHYRDTFWFFWLGGCAASPAGCPKPKPCGKNSYYCANSG
uniref:M48 family metalloprotease n=1 Tax=Desertifilum tharense IPPAS B-1220 TaxID=1781255 RepID=A0ACD5H1Y5_9CYAN